MFPSGFKKFFSVRLPLSGLLLCSQCQWGPNLTSGQSVWSPFEPQLHPQSIWVEAEKAYFRMQFAQALNWYSKLPAGYPRWPQYYFLGSRIFTGLAGLTFYSWIDAISQNPPPSGFASFKGLMNIWKSTNLDLNHLSQAHGRIRQWRAGAEPHYPEEKYFIAFHSVNHLGAFLRQKADIDADGVTDTSVDSCSNNQPFSDDDIKQLIVLWKGVVDFYQYLPDPFKAYVQDLVNHVCPNSPSVCQKVQLNQVTSTEITNFRKWLKDKDRGIEPTSGCQFSGCCP